MRRVRLLLTAPRAGGEASGGRTHHKTPATQSPMAMQSTKMTHSSSLMNAPNESPKTRAQPMDEAAEKGGPQATIGGVVVQWMGRLLRGAAIPFLWDLWAFESCHRVK